MPVRETTGTHPSRQRWPPTSGGWLAAHLIPGGRRASGPDHLKSVGGWEMTLEEDKRRDGRKPVPQSTAL